MNCKACGCPASAHRYQDDGQSVCGNCGRVGCRSIQPKRAGGKAPPPVPSLGECSTGGCGDPTPALDPHGFPARIVSRPDGTTAIRTASETETVDPFAKARRVLDRALAQSQYGKGLARHGSAGERFEDQLIVQIGRATANTGFEIGQAVKKLLESTRLSPDRAVKEILGAIMYSCAAVVLIEDELGQEVKP